MDKNNKLRNSNSNNIVVFIKNGIVTDVNNPSDWVVEVRDYDIQEMNSKVRLDVNGHYMREIFLPNENH